MQKSFCFKIFFFLFLSNFIFAVWKYTQLLLKYFESSDVIVVKKKSLLKVY